MLNQIRLFFLGWLALPTITLLFSFLLLDLISLGLAWMLGNDIFFETRFLRLARDRGFSEILQYLKFIMMIILLWRAYKSEKNRVLFSWVVLFSIMLVDDFAGLHEAIGKLLVRLFELPYIGGLSPHDLSEILAFAGMEGIALCFVLWCTLFASGSRQKFSFLLLVALLPLVLSGIVLDVLPVKDLESIGEIMSMSILLFFVRSSLDKYSSSTLSQKF